MYSELCSTRGDGCEIFAWIFPPNLIENELRKINIYVLWINFESLTKRKDDIQGESCYFVALLNEFSSKRQFWNAHRGNDNFCKSSLITKAVYCNTDVLYHWCKDGVNVLLFYECRLFVSPNNHDDFLQCIHFLLSATAIWGKKLKTKKIAI